MYDINTKNIKKGKNFYYIFLAFGLFFFILMGTVTLSNYIKLFSMDSSTTSTSVRVESHSDDDGYMYSPTYYYKVDGKSYSCTSDISSSNYPGTTNKTVYYDSKDPSKCMTEFSKSNNNFFFLFIIIPVVFIVVAVINIRKIRKRVKLVNELNKKGKLVKNLPYYLDGAGISINDNEIQRPVVKYTLPSGSIITLYGDPRYDLKSCDEDGMVDLVIDENNPNNYFIDFNINRLTGNLPTDYYNQNNNIKQADDIYKQSQTNFNQDDNNPQNSNIE